jgi:hypothetical protein
MSSSSGHSGSRSMFIPKSTSGRWVMLLFVLWLVWMMVNHPSDAIDLFQAFFGFLGDLATTIYDAYKESRNT